LSFTTDFYGKGAAYNQLAGRDASYAIATWSLEDKDNKTQKLLSF
jgi:hypothetical protein